MEGLKSRTSSAEVKQCQRSCKGLFLYFGRSAPHGQDGSEVCLGLSGPLREPRLDLQKIHEARQVPAGQHVTFGLILGHAVYTPSSGNASSEQGLPPGCASGIEVVQFSKPVGAAPREKVSSPVAPSTSESAAGSLPNRLGAALTSVTSGIRLLSSDDVNGRVNKVWAGLSNFDTSKFAEKVSKRAVANYDAMGKWVNDLFKALSSPKSS